MTNTRGPRPSGYTAPGRTAGAGTNRLKRIKLLRLPADQRTTLLKLIATGTAAARKLLYARILLKADGRPAGPGTDRGLGPCRLPLSEAL